RSRTIATTSTRVTAAEAPIPTREAISSGKVPESAHSSANAAYSVTPAASTGFRPNRSASGPQISWVDENPMKYAITTSCRSFSLITWSERPIAGNAGIIASIANELRPMSAASIAVISRVPGRFTPSLKAESNMGAAPAGRLPVAVQQWEVKKGGGHDSAAELYDRWGCDDRGDDPADQP